jgi:H+/Cl- antiporter ClcA
MRLGHLLSYRHWQARLLMWGAAAAVGAAAVAFAKIADVAQWGLKRVIGVEPWAPWVLAPAGFFLIAWLTRRYFRGAEGSGIPQTIFAIRRDSGELGQMFLRPTVVIGRVLLAGAALFCGGSIGREGPTVHVGAVIVNSVGRLMPGRRFPGQRHALVLAGGAAGVAAAFNTPLAGVVFAIEELSRSFEERASGTTLTTVILAGVVAIAFTGDYTYFGQPQVSALAAKVTPEVLVVAAACGLGGGLFSLLTLKSTQWLPGPLQRLRREHPARFAGFCGLLVAALGALSGSLTYGTGYDEARSIIANNAHLPWG